MAFYLPSLALSALAGLGADRLLRQAGAVRRALIGWGVFGALGLLGAVGALQSVTEDLARATGFPGRPELAIANAGSLQSGGVRLLAFAAAGFVVVLLIQRARLTRWAAALALSFLLLGDLWSVGRHYFAFSPPASEVFAPDEIMATLQQVPQPYRVWEPGGRFGRADPYVGSWLMAAGIPVTFGYHGNEIRFFDDLWGGKNDWEQQVNPNLHRLYGVGYAVLNQPVELPGYHQVMGPVKTAFADGYLYQADTMPSYVRVVTAAAKIPEDQLVATVTDPRFPVDRLAVFPDTASITPAPLAGGIPAASAVTPTVSSWEPGRIVVTLAGSDSAISYLIVGENWYPTWQATIDGVSAPVLRADNALLSVALPSGAREVTLEFQSPSYRRGRAISLVSLVGILGLFGMAAGRRSRS